MLNKSSLLLFAGVLLFCQAGQAVPAKQATNYVEFYVNGDCHQDDCIALFKDSIANDQPLIVSMNLDALAPHESETYRKITFSFKDLKTAPYSDIMQKVSSLGYQVVSYAIHDTHTGKDIIIPH
jgi:hypothetical protein